VIPADSKTGFGSYIRQLRESKSMTGTELARQLGRNPSYISKIERGEVPPPGEFIIQKLAEIFGQEPETLLLMANKLSTESMSILQLKPGAFDILIKACKDMSVEDLKKVAQKVRDGKW
jgi:transcriptional regulator with XRE-family HTH domain